MGADELVMGPEKEDKRQRTWLKMSRKGQNRLEMREKLGANEQSDSCGSVNCAMTLLCDAALNIQHPNTLFIHHPCTWWQLNSLVIGDVYLLYKFTMPNKLSYKGIQK